MDVIPKPVSHPKEKMRVACFMSGSGTNVQRIIERSLQPDASYRVVLIFSDIKHTALDKEGKIICNALDIAKENRIDYECIDIIDYYLERGQHSKKDLSLRPGFDELVVKKIEPYKIDLIVLGGYMSIQTAPLLERYKGRIINVHPADLTIMNGMERKYVGMHTIRDAIMEGEKYLKSTSHIVREKVDNGEILIVSKPIPVRLPIGVTLEKIREDKVIRNVVIEDHKARLKKEGDWIIYPLTVQMIGEGRFILKNDLLFLDGKPAPHGLIL
jgi:folate-dependent phosphoribosylglycinamide formyltransferase PurN